MRINSNMMKRQKEKENGDKGGIFFLQSMKPFWTMSQMSTLDGSPKLERQVKK